MDMATLSMDLRRRIVAANDRKQGTQEEVAKRFAVSLGMVKKLLLQRSRTGDIAPRHRFSGRKPKLLAEHRDRLRALVAEKPDRTLAQLREAAGLACTLPAIHYVLISLGLTYKKRHSGQPSKAGPTSSRPAGSGFAARAASTRPGWSSSTSRPPRRT